MSFDLKCDCTPPTIVLQLILCPWMGVICFWWDLTFSLRRHFPVNGCSAASCDFYVLAGEDDGLMVQNVDFRLSELDGRDAFDLEKLIEVDIDAILAFQFGIWRLFKIRRSVLGYQDVFDLHFQSISHKFQNPHIYLIIITLKPTSPTRRRV